MRRLHPSFARKEPRALNQNTTTPRKGKTRQIKMKAMRMRIDEVSTGGYCWTIHVGRRIANLTRRLAPALAPTGMRRSVHSTLVRPTTGGCRASESMAPPSRVFQSSGSSAPGWTASGRPGTGRRSVNGGACGGGRSRAVALASGWEDGRWGTRRGMRGTGSASNLR